MLNNVITDTLEICAVPAPTGAESRRATDVAARLAAAGLRPHSDPAGNVIARIGADGDPAVIVAAHLDTVFGADTPIDPRRAADRLHGPGIGDNALGLAGLIEVGRSIVGAGTQPRVPLVLAATVGEEGLGDLRGMRALLSRTDASCVVAVEGHGIDSVVTRAVASYRYVVRYRGPGGHSWRDRDRPSALHALFSCASRAIGAAPPATINIGVTHGGTSVNTIASEAVIEVDLRSLDEPRLDDASKRVVAALRAAPRGITVDVVEAGRRPGGSLPAGHPLIHSLEQARRQAGLPPAVIDAASTDANAALGGGVPAIAIGLTRGSGTHAVNESIELAPIAAGVQALVRLVHLLAGLPQPELPA